MQVRFRSFIPLKHLLLLAVVTALLCSTLLARKTEGGVVDTT